MIYDTPLTTQAHLENSFTYRNETPKQSDAIKTRASKGDTTQRKQSGNFICAHEGNICLGPCHIAATTVAKHAVECAQRASQVCGTTIGQHPITPIKHVDGHDFGSPQHFLTSQCVFRVEAIAHVMPT